jgi:excisionase family DNA binding protein
MTVAPPQLPRRFLSKAEVAELLGVSVRTIDRHIHDDVMPLPAVKVGTGRNAHVRVDPVALACWLERPKEIG